MGWLIFGLFTLFFLVGVFGPLFEPIIPMGAPDEDQPYLPMVFAPGVAALGAFLWGLAHIHTNRTYLLLYEKLIKNP